MFDVFGSTKTQAKSKRLSGIMKKKKYQHGKLLVALKALTKLLVYTDEILTSLHKYLIGGFNHIIP